MSVIKEFKAFISRGNVIDLAVGVIIGGAFGKIVSSLVGDIIMPLIALIHRRFAGKHNVDGTVIVRQAIWVGVYGDILVWLMMGRVMTAQMAVFLALGFILIEFFLRMRERSQFQPGVPENE